MDEVQDKTALIAVDVQRDFLDGSLGGEGRDAVIQPLCELARATDFVIASRDWHPEDHCSFADFPTFTDQSWPPHCVQHSFGAEIDPSIERLADVIISKGDDPAKEAYSAFDGHDSTGKPLDVILFEKGITRVVIGGLCTDYCVKATALDAIERNFKTIVVLDACRSVSLTTLKSALTELDAAGVEWRSVPFFQTFRSRVQSVIDQVVGLAEEAEHANYSALSSWYGEVCKWIRAQEKKGQAFTFTLPDVQFEQVLEFQIPT